MKARIVIDSVRPTTLTGRYPAKAVEDEVVPVSADIFKDGHDVISARVGWKASGDRQLRYEPLTLELNDRWTGTMRPSFVGMHEFTVEAWTDVFATWHHKIETKMRAAQNVSVELQEGIAFFEQRAAEATSPDARSKLQQVSTMLADDKLDHASRVASATTADITELVSVPGATDVVTSVGPLPLWVDRRRALYGSWYELFPRSHGGLKGVAEHLDYVQEMGFDVVYLPPIHPIGTAFRKGKNNTLNPTPDDVGSPWAIGNSDGGHMAVHADLGTIDDFDELVNEARNKGLEVALDYALQCSADHPWVKEHPEWFNQRPDGTIAYAENPPKKYQDIYPINFWPESDDDRQALWNACKEILDYWIDHGVRIFRVDNPHTKPIAFWSWVIPEIQANNPDIIFLAEAFTKPKMMAKLAEVGFSQSYTYFTWRRTKEELTEYGVEVSSSEKADYMRPNFWPNTPDILAHPLRNAPLSAFRSRAVLAATMAPSYGMYSGYELGENEPFSDSNEEYLHSEKYETKHRDFNATHSIAPYITRINEARKRHPALQELRNIWFHGADNDNVICFSKRSAAASDTVIVVVNLDPYNPQECTLSLNMAELNLGWDDPFQVHDELTNRTFHWWGQHNYVRLDTESPAHILHIRPERQVMTGTGGNQ